MSANNEVVQEHLWERIADAVAELGGRATRHEVWEHLKKNIPDINFSTVTAQLNSLSVNSPGRTSYHPGKHPRRTDSGNRYDRLFKVGRGTGTYYVPYNPSEHGVWEIYADPSASSTNKTSIRQIGEIAFTAQSAIEYLESRYPPSDSGTSHISAFRNSRGRELAFDPGKDPLRKTVLQVFVDASPDGFQLDEITEYPADKARNHHLAAHAPSLAVGNRAFAVRIDSLDALRRLADWYDAKTPDQNTPTQYIEESTMPKPTTMPQPTNKILFGPPGTGKTYRTIDEALRILDPEFLNANSDAGKRALLKQRFEELKKEGRVRFVTFHQSFSYEDFVEGIRASTDEVSKQLTYKIESGIFKEICEAAGRRTIGDLPASFDVQGRRIWKISLGEASSEGHVFDECMEKKIALLGFGHGVDLSGVTSREDINERLTKVLGAERVEKGDVIQLETFLLKVKKGDLLVATQGNHRFRAIGEVVGDYEFLDREDDGHYVQARRVRWIQYQPSRPHIELMDKNFMQRTIYELRPGSINLEKLRSLIASKASESTDAKPHVLIIDEINRGSVSRIFGELITLIEPSKRLGADEALSVTLPYSKDDFFVPSNVHLIGTMNTADRSLATIDIALRRRFEFEELLPDPEQLKDVRIEGIPLNVLLSTINRRIEVLLGRDFMIGHAYFMPVKAQPTMEALAEVFRRKVIPLLQEYFFEDWTKIAQVLNDHRPAKPKELRFLRESEGDVLELFGEGIDLPGVSRRWTINPNAFEQPEAYQWIIGPREG